MESARDRYLSYLCKVLKASIEKQERENPTTRLKCKLVKTDKKAFFYVYSLRVISISRKIKISQLLSEEEKLFVQTQEGPMKCTVVGIDMDVIMVIGYRKLKGYDFEAVVDFKQNNEILLNKLEGFIESEKDFNEAITRSWKMGRGEKPFMDKDGPDACELELENNDGIDFYDAFLNESQKRAVVALQSKMPYKILGPPGTGKTRAVVEIISQILSCGGRVLVCGPSNVSIDNIIERFLRSQYFSKSQPSFYRLGSSTKGLRQFNLAALAESHTKFMKEEKNDRSFQKDKREKQRLFTEDKQNISPIVFSTLFSALKEKGKFDWVIVDEACQASEVESFLAVVKAKCFILVGDPMQLCPDSPSLYELLDLPTILLNEQYRMCEKLLEFSNMTFYNGLVKSSIKNSLLMFNESPILFVDTQCFEMHETVGEVSKSNLGEAEIVQSIVSFLEGEEIGIIAPYTSQVLLLQEMVSVEVATVDGFQGQERDYIILTLVRSNDRGDFGFLSDEKRLNVALTRCRKGLIIVGDSENFRKSGIFRKLFSFLEGNSLCVDPETLKAYIQRQ